MSTPARQIQAMPSRLGPTPVAYRQALAVLLSLGMVGLVAPVAEALRSPLTVFADTDAGLAAPSSVGELAQLVRLARSHRELIAAQAARSGTDRSADLAQLRAERRQLLHRLLERSDTDHSISPAEVHGLQAEWAELERVSAEAGRSAASVFALHSALIDRQLALLSSARAHTP